MYMYIHMYVGEGEAGDVELVSEEIRPVCLLFSLLNQFQIIDRHHIRSILLFIYCTCVG